MIAYSLMNPISAWIQTRRWMALAMSLIACFVLATAGYSDTGENNIVTDKPGTFFSGTSVNQLIGATRFYNAGFTGQGTITANVEAGHIWSGHETLGHITNFQHDAAAFGTTTNELFDRHATWVGSMIGGRTGGSSPGNYQVGIASGTDLRSGAIATNWSGSAYSLGFGISVSSFNGGYRPFFGTADVINSSWGGTDSAGSSGLAIALDGFAKQNSNTTFVVSAGNSGPTTNSVGFPGSGYNAITVGALDNGGNNSYNTVASFSSRGPQDFYDAAANAIIGGVRAAVDIVAPGSNLTGAFYGGQTGGNNTTLSGSANTAGSNLYSTSIAGTSFASPIVAAAVALVKSASYNTPALNNTAARDTLVVKSILQNSTDKISGWNNGQVANSNGFGGVATTQSMDYASGAGKLNLDRAFDQYVNASTTDVAGTASGALGIVGAVGWDLGKAVFGTTNLYTLGSLLQGGSLLNVTLNWFRDRFYDPSLLQILDTRQADLNLRIVNLDTSQLISISNSLYNMTELLSFTLPTTAHYGIEVQYLGNTFGTATGAVDYGLAWSGVVAVPEPRVTMLLGLVSLTLAVRFFRREELGQTQKA